MKTGLEDGSRRLRERSRGDQRRNRENVKGPAEAHSVLLRMTKVKGKLATAGPLAVKRLDR